MYHQISNQEIARIRYADALRNATRHVSVEVDVEPPRPHALRSRVRLVIGNLVAQVPPPRPVAR